MSKSTRVNLSLPPPIVEELALLAEVPDAAGYVPGPSRVVEKALELYSADRRANPKWRARAEQLHRARAATFERLLGATGDKHYEMLAQLRSAKPVEPSDGILDAESDRDDSPKTTVETIPHPDATGPHGTVRSVVSNVPAEPELEDRSDEVARLMASQKEAARALGLES